MGVYRSRLGWLVVLGSGRERLTAALACRHGAHPFPGGDGQTRCPEKLDRLVGDGDVRAFIARNVSGALWRPDLGARFRCRSQTRHPDPRTSRPRDWFFLHFVCRSYWQSRTGRSVQLALARIPAAHQQCSDGLRPGSRHVGDPLPTGDRSPDGQQNVGGPTVFQCRVCAPVAAGRLANGDRALQSMEIDAIGCGNARHAVAAPGRHAGDRTDHLALGETKLAAGSGSGCCGHLGLRHGRAGSSAAGQAQTSGWITAPVRSSAPAWHVLLGHDRCPFWHCRVCRRGDPGEKL